MNESMETKKYPPPIIDTLETCFLCVAENRRSDFMKYETRTSTLFCPTCGDTIQIGKNKKIMLMQVINELSDDVLLTGGYALMFKLDDHRIRHAFLLGNECDVLLCAFSRSQIFFAWYYAWKFRKLAYFEKDSRKFDDLLSSMRSG